jgi:methylenetetrahydrofolate dehydrogenase (NADP+)/methenyltetrahydrofolate cyclohydrolase
VCPYIEILLIGDNEDSERYVNLKLRKIKDVGADGNIRKINESKSDDDILKIINELNVNKKVHGVLVQLPLPEKFNQEKILSEIILEKDVDALNPITLEKIEQQTNLYYPAGVDAVLEIFERFNVKINGKKIIIVGVTNLFGKPLSSVLRQMGGIINEIEMGKHLTFEELSTADVIISDFGRPKWIKRKMVKDQVIIIDAANNYVNGKVIGDADMDELLDKIEIITPVPGGLGPILVASLIKNLVKSAEIL